MTSQIAVEAAKVATPALSLDHGDTMVSPMPEPRSIRMKVSVDAIMFSYRMNSMRRMMMGMGIPSSQSRMPRPMIFSSPGMSAEKAAPGLRDGFTDQAALAISLAEASASPVSASSVMDSSPSV